MPMLNHDPQDAAGQNPSTQHHQRPSTPTAPVFGRSSFNDASPGVMYKSSMQEPSEQQLEAYAASFSSSNRQDLIQRLKRSHSPTLQRNVSTNPFYRPHVSRDLPIGTSLLPAIDLDAKGEHTVFQQSNDCSDISISGELTDSAINTSRNQKENHFPEDFHQDLKNIQPDQITKLAGSPSTSWYKPVSSPPSGAATVSPGIDIPNSTRMPQRTRVPSFSSYSSSFVPKAPTSPLVHQSNRDEAEFSPIDLEASPTATNRRHTLPPHSFQTFRSGSGSMTLAQAARQPPSLQREHTVPFQSHHVRRSYTGLPFPPSPSLATPNFLRSRRSSFASDASPIQASMVGSYEESILRGRMSMTPSKPLDFTAQIGALGKGDCKPKYPAHVSVDFPAVYYSWNMSNGGSISDEPSPYVGQIDLEHKLNVPVPKDRPRKRRETQSGQQLLMDTSILSKDARRQEKRLKRSRSPHGSLDSFGGCYRIPQQGQLQILIKNPHKTAVKLFLVPYDLEGMLPGTKTFVRQRSYSAGPVMETPLTTRSFPDSITETKQKLAETKPILRYLVQLNICCPAKGRFYLYRSIHVVFANRVPDDKEKLQTEILWPEPRYSHWKPSKTDSASSTPSRRQSIDMDAKRRSLSSRLEAADGLAEYSRTSLRASHLELFSMSQASKDPITLEESKLAFRNINPDIYTKLNPGDSGYGGRPATPDPGQGLLTRRLRGIDNENPNETNESMIGVEDMELE